MELNLYYSDERIARLDKLGGCRKRERGRVIEETLYNWVKRNYLQRITTTRKGRNQCWYTEIEELSTAQAVEWIKANLPDEAAARFVPVLWEYDAKYR